MEHMPIVGCDGGPVGAVAAVGDGQVRLGMEADRAIKLATISTGSEAAHGMGSMGAASWAGEGQGRRPL